MGTLQTPILQSGPQRNVYDTSPNPHHPSEGPAFSGTTSLTDEGFPLRETVFKTAVAFAAQALADGKGLSWDWDRVNVNGGAVALGHPIGASGARILATLIYALKDRGLKTGMATLCLGGGNAVALAIEIV